MPEKRFPTDFIGQEVMAKWEGVFPGTMTGKLKQGMFGVEIVAEGVGKVYIPYNKISYIDDTKLPILIYCGLEVHEYMEVGK